MNRALSALAARPTLRGLVIALAALGTGWILPRRAGYAPDGPGVLVGLLRLHGLVGRVGQDGQVRQLSTMQPTPTWSPVLNLVTSEPTSATTPAISCPGTSGRLRRVEVPLR